MEPSRPRAFADQWCAAWNAHDVEAVLAHFADDVVFSSPVAAALLPDSAGVLRGKGALRHYWTEGLRHVPDLRFEVLGAYAGLDTLVIHYRNQKGGLVCEVLRLRDGLVVEGHGTYLASESDTDLAGTGR
ncbi:nuclear transport factor 2 family protein [Mumia sp. zg.B53]|uniref:nuclear transport factor 2 family protein n=1 Tax=Mumia sp. zg.B53 TaxID=2855449 RepID=UPI001C6E182D|nr:nuclear transport factor 2 family protein [Mumia sp. zg.B53]MBW9214961.1 nuclear transport factor 2 family protein [Mumia sp. zg.B53]